MKKKLDEVIGYLDYDELVKIRKDLTMGGMYLAGLVEEQLFEENKKHDVRCAICSNKLEPYSVNNFTLVFGPEDLKKKASFCALDCLEYFLVNLKDIRSAKEDPHLSPAPALRHQTAGRRPQSLNT